MLSPIQNLFESEKNSSLIIENDSDDSDNLLNYDDVEIEYLIDS